VLCCKQTRSKSSLPSVVIVGAALGASELLHVMQIQRATGTEFPFDCV